MRPPTGLTGPACRRPRARLGGAYRAVFVAGRRAKSIILVIGVGKAALCNFYALRQLAKLLQLTSLFFVVLEHDISFAIVTEVSETN